MSKMVLLNQDNIDLVADNKKYLIKDFKGNKIDIVVNDDIETSFLYFSRFEDKTDINIVVKENANIKFEYILMNDNSNINLNVNIDGSHSNVLIKNLSLVKNGNKAFNVYISHNAKDSNSTVSNNGISFENGHNVFNITSLIKKDMTHSNARQLTRGLILDDTASCKALPILLIDHHDVAAYHGASIGKINDEDLFYLMSRGLTKNEAFMLIINGMLEPFINEIEEEDLKKEILDKYHEYFGA